MYPMLIRNDIVDLFISNKPTPVMLFAMVTRTGWFYGLVTVEKYFFRISRLHDPVIVLQVCISQSVTMETYKPNLLAYLRAFTFITLDLKMVSHSNTSEGNCKIVSM